MKKVPICEILPSKTQEIYGFCLLLNKHQTNLFLTFSKHTASAIAPIYYFLISLLVVRTLSLVIKYYHRSSIIKISLSRIVHETLVFIGPYIPLRLGKNCLDSICPKYKHLSLVFVDLNSTSNNLVVLVSI